MRQPWFASTISSSVRADRVAHGLDDLHVAAPVGVVEAELDRAHAAVAQRRRRGPRAPPASTSSPLDAYASRRSERPPSSCQSGVSSAGRRGPRPRPRASSGARRGSRRSRQSSRTTSVRSGSRPTSGARAARRRAGGRRWRSRRAVVGGDDDERRVLRRARHGVPGRAEGRVERRTRSGGSRCWRCAAATHWSVQRWTPPRGDRPAPAPPRPPSGPTASRMAAADGLAVGRPSARSRRWPRRTTQTATSSDRSSTCSAGSVPSATQSSTPCAMPSWAAPQVRRAEPLARSACSC